MSQLFSSSSPRRRTHETRTGALAKLLCWRKACRAWTALRPARPLTCPSILRTRRSQWVLSVGMAARSERRTRDAKSWAGGGLSERSELLTPRRLTSRAARYAASNKGSKERGLAVDVVACLSKLVIRLVQAKGPAGTSKLVEVGRVNPAASLLYGSSADRPLLPSCRF